MCSFSEISFNEFAFDVLMMLEQRKVLVGKLVCEYLPKGKTMTLKASIDQVV